MDLDPRESINNMGKLRVDILDGADLPSADRNGKSDPYCKFELNGVEVHKTEVQKKTLHPVWNEFFEVEVPSRIGANFTVDVYDYDFAGKPDFLGATSIPLDGIEPFKASEGTYPLDGKSGSIRVRLLFRPDYVRRAGQGESTFSGPLGAPGRIVTGVAGVPLKGGVAVASGVGKGATFLRRGIFGGKKDDDGASEVAVPVIATNGTDSPPADASSTPVHSRTKSFGGSSIRSGHPGGGSGTGTANLTIVSAAGYPASSDLYVTVTQLAPREKTVGKTKHYKSSEGTWSFNESFKTMCSPETPFKIEVKGEHFLGSDDDLGEHAYFVDDSGSGAPKELTVGGGTVTVKSTFQAAETSNLSADSPRSISRRSFMGKRENGRLSREATPS